METAFEDVPTVWIPMPDGVRLAARLWLPDGPPAGAVLEYLPYRRRDGTSLRDASVYPAFAKLGLAGVRVDIRGTGDSEGHFDDEYSEQELSDGEAVIAWIAAQPWCNGNVGMMGISWGGFNALQLAARKPPALKAVISIASTVDRFADDIHFKGGTHLSANLYWATQMLGRAAMPPDASVVGDGWRAQWLDRLEHLPALMFPWMAHQRRDAFWKHGSICEDFSAVQAPALVIAGWADGYRNTPWDAREGLGDKARAISGPWVHLYPHFAVPEPRLDFIAEAARWWGQYLQGRDTGAEALPAHRLYLSEAVRPDQTRIREPGRWIEITQGEATETLLRLSPGQLGAEGGGEVTVSTPLDCGVDGGEFFTQGADTDLPDDQRADDGLSVCFETEPLDAPMDIIGRPTLTIPIALDAPQGNLIARLVDVHPDGTAHRISLGVLNLSHRMGSESPAAMTPGRVEEGRVTLDATAYRLRPGHRLRLAISTAYYPMILPPPTDVTATLSLEYAALQLPSAPYTEITLPQAGADTRPAFPSTPASIFRRCTRDRASGRTDVTVESDSGTTTHPDYGIAWRDIRRSDYTITRGDPLSYRAVEVCTNERTHGGHLCRVIATGQLRATATDWIINARIEATQDGETVFTRDWTQTIARDHM
ncbi:CocE/NonD family hydrolase [Gymnodinialimonas sp.]